MVYTTEIRKKILDDPELFSKICAITGKNAYAMSQMVRRNNSALLRDFNIVKTIKQHTGRSENSILASSKPKLSTPKRSA